MRTPCPLTTMSILPPIPARSLILHGGKDPIVPLSYSERAVEVLKNAELIVYPGQGHGFMGSQRNHAMQTEAAFFAGHME